MPNFPRTILTDTGFWYALYNPRDQYHSQATSKAGFLEQFNIIIPWPCLYETLNTRFSRNKLAISRFESFLRQDHVTLLKDESYRESALESVFATAQSRGMALVDMVVRLILQDVNVRKHAMLTFNPADFSDLCHKHGVDLL